MLDSYLILAPLLLLPVVALLRFIGCNQILGISVSEVEVVVEPALVSLGPGETQEFTALVNGEPSSAVTWSTDSEAGAPNGLFTAPAPFVLGPPTVKVTATSTASSDVSAFATVTLIGNGVKFVSPPDLITKGAWNGVYGQAGFALADKPADLLRLPPFLPVLTLPPQSRVFQYEDPSVDPRALQRPPNFSDRFSSVWFENVLNLEFAFSDSRVHQAAFYFCDWPNEGRTQKIEFLDTSPAGAPILLDSRDISAFREGQYLIWYLQGTVTMRITKVAGPDAILHGIFFNS